MQNSSPVALELQRLLRPTACSFREKHTYQIDRRIHGGVILICKWTLCQQRKVVSNAVLRMMVAR
ncbi:hypothetical protein IXEL_37 [Microbacterium phage Ixel]|nr:hypothetical protein IXEL_37 [Microbacterium phage Ixel]